MLPGKPEGCRKGEQEKEQSSLKNPDGKLEVQDHPDPGNHVLSPARSKCRNNDQKKDEKGRAEKDQTYSSNRLEWLEHCFENLTDHSEPQERRNAVTDPIQIKINSRV